VAGDFLYGTEDPALGRHALHSASLQFTQPVTGQELRFTCPLPPQLQAYLKEKEIPYDETFDF